MQDYVRKYYIQLKFNSAVDVTARKEAANPKRMQRKARKLAAEADTGTKSQQALQLQREAEKQRRFDLKQQKRKKHRDKIMFEKISSNEAYATFKGLF